jgi:hypothetical protein
VVEAGAGQGRARGDPFIGARGEGSCGARWTPVRFTVTKLMLHSGGDKTARRGRCCARTRPQQRGRGGAKFPCAASSGGEEERTVVGGDRGEAVHGEGKGVADWRGQPVSGARRERGRGWGGWRVGSACQWE